MQVILSWLRSVMADTQLVVLLASLLGIFLLILLVGNMLAPVLAAIALAYVLDGIVVLLQRCKVPRLLAIVITGSGALLILLLLLVSVLPLLSEQVGRLVEHAPQYVQAIRTMLEQLQENYADWMNPNYLQNAIATFGGKLQEWGGALLKFSIASIPGLITLMVYVVLVPVLVFFLLKDKEKIIRWGQQFLPADHSLLDRVWKELDVQIGNYIRGKFWETVAVGLGMLISYWWMGHEYALLLAVLTGISVWIPFVGAAVVTIPVVLLSFFQWGWSDMTLYALLAYAIVQALDANLMVPWLFSEMVDLHPIAIIVAILAFGAMWGLLGVVIAIPMAALVKSVLSIMFERGQAAETPPAETSG